MPKFNASQHLAIDVAFFKARQGLLINAAFVSFFVLGAITITYVYVSIEHTFYWWDFVTYQEWTRAMANAFLEPSKNGLYKVVSLLTRIWKSTARDYNDFPTLLLFPFSLTLGYSRLVYILSIVLVYLLPFALVLGAIAVKLLPAYPHTVYWSTVLLTLLTPVAWAPTLRGYPDVGGALLIALAILVYLQDVKLRSWRQIALIGFLIAVAALFRRHFIFDGVAFFEAVILQALIAFVIQVRQQSPDVWQNLSKRSAHISWTVAVSLTTFAVLGLPFIVKVLIGDFGRLNTSYEVSLSECLRYYGLAYGLVAWMLAVLGFAVGIRTRVLNRPVATFVLSFSGFLLLQWVLVAKQPNLQYNLHFTLFVVLGLASFAWTAWRTLSGKRLTFVLGVSGAYLILNVLLGLAPLDLLRNTPIRPTSFNPSYSGMGYSGDVAFTKLGALFSAHYPPLKHPDYDEIVRLVDYLRSIAPAKEPIYIAASSELFNSSILREADSYVEVMKPGGIIKAERTEGTLKIRELNILPSSDIDSRGSYPLENLLRAQYVVLATPLQYHLHPKEQDVLKVGVDAFTENWEIAHDFTRLPIEFTLANGALVSVYQRLHSTSLETALRTFIAMQKRIGARPGAQLDWISLSEVPGHQIDRRKLGGKYFLETSNREAPATSFLYIGALPDHARITGKLRRINNACASASLRFNAIDAQGEVIKTAELVHHSTDTPEFTLSLQTQNAAYLHFNISVRNDNDVSHYCAVRIEPLSVKE